MLCPFFVYNFVGFMKVYKKDYELYWNKFSKSRNQLCYSLVLTPCIPQQAVLFADWYW